MAKELAVGYISIVPELKTLASNLTGSEMTNIGKKAGAVADKGMASSIGRNIMGKIAALGIGTLIVSEMKKGLAGASDLIEAQNKVDAVFKSSAKSVHEFGAKGAKSLGMAKQTALDAAGTFGNLITATGLADDKAADMSTTMVQLAADLASFNNTSVDDALLALRSGLAGETEPLKRFGVNLNDVTLKMKAMELGIYDGTGALTPAIKMQAAYAVIMEQTATQQGDFVRNADELANTQKIVAAQWENIRTSIMAAAYPAITQLANAVSDLLSKWEGLSEEQQDNIVKTVAWAAGIAAGVYATTQLAGGLNQLIGLYKTLTAAKIADAAAGTASAAATTASGTATGAAAGALGKLSAALGVSTGGAIALAAGATAAAVGFGLAVVEATKWIGKNRPLQESIDAVRRSTQELDIAVRALESAELDERQAKLDVTTTTTLLTQAQQGYSDAIREYGESSQQAIDAARRLEQATIDKERAEQRYSGAIEATKGKMAEAAQQSQQNAAVTREMAEQYGRATQGFKDYNTEITAGKSGNWLRAHAGEILSLQNNWLAAFYAQQRYAGAIGGTRAKSFSGSRQMLFAEGGIVSQATPAIIGEAGPEIVIPLSASRRRRGVDLLSEAMSHMGFTASPAGVNLTINGLSIPSSDRDAVAVVERLVDVVSRYTNMQPMGV